jgi:uncharacterized membrane protein (DUF485 family)
MLHEPAPRDSSPDHASDRKAGLGLWLFAAYSLVYVGFVAINILRPQWMKEKILLGQNLAVVYGFGLILLAVVMGIIYNRICTKMEDDMNSKGGSK